MIWAFLSVLKVEAFAVLGSLQRPFILFSALAWMKNTVVRLRINVLALILLFWVVITVTWSLIIYQEWLSLRPFANWVLFFAAFLWSHKRLGSSGSEKWLIFGLRGALFSVLIDAGSFATSGTLIFTFTGPDKYFPSGVFPEPSDVPPYALIYILLVKRWFDKLFAVLLLLLYSAVLFVETTAALMLFIVFARLLNLVLKKQKRILVPVIFFLLSGVMFIQTIFLEDLSFNESARNRLSSPVYFQLAAFSSPQVIFGRGLGSVTYDFAGITKELSQFLSQPLSAEQANLDADFMDKNANIFNMHIRIIYEMGLLFYVLLVYFIQKRSNDFFILGMFYWLINDVLFNPFFIIGAGYSGAKYR